MKYRGHWEIVASTMGYDWYHEDFDGAPMDYDGPPADRRYGWDLSVAYAQSSIDEFIIDYHWPVRERAELTYRTEHSREESRRLRADLLRAEWVRRPKLCDGVIHIRRPGDVPDGTYTYNPARRWAERTCGEPLDQRGFCRQCDRQEFTDAT